MKNLKGIIFGLLIIFLPAASPVFSQGAFKDLQNAADNVIDDLAASVPFNSAIGLNWSDAYIGSFPHFGAGVSLGATTIDFQAVSGLMNMFGIPLDVSGFFEGIGFPLPAYTVEARIGGIIIPVDIGVKFGVLNPDFAQVSGLGLDYLLFGADIRYALINKKVFPIRLSVGIGFNYMKGGISAALPSLTFNDPIYNVTIPVDSTAEVLWNTLNFEAKAQVSFPFMIITPYLGAGASYSSSEAGYKIASTSSINIPSALKDEYGLTGSANGFEYVKEINSFNIRAFGGFSLNLVFVRLDLTAMLNILNGNYGATAGLRFQL